MEIFGKAVFGILAVALSVIIGGYVFMVLWGWFIAPTFHIQNITLAQALGISLLYDFIRTKVKDKENEDDSLTNKLAVMLGKELLGAALFLSIGWIVTLFL